MEQYRKISADLSVDPHHFRLINVNFLEIRVQFQPAQTELVKTILANQGKPLPAPKKIVSPENTRLTLGIRIGIAVVAVALIIAGIANGGMADVLAKAINICTECIGLG